MGILVGLLICLMSAGIIFYLALSKNKLIPKLIKYISRFLLLPLYPYLKYGDSLKGIGGTITIFIGIVLVIFIISLFFKAITNIIK
jgi:hypothetical protein